MRFACGFSSCRRSGTCCRWWLIISSPMERLLGSSRVNSPTHTAGSCMIKRLLNYQTSHGSTRISPHGNATCWQATSPAPTWHGGPITLARPMQVSNYPSTSLARPTQERPARAHTFTLTDSTFNALRSRCKAERCTPFVLLMAAWQSLLSRHAGSDDFCIGVPTSGRTREESEDLIGLFVDTQVYRARVQPAMTGPLAAASGTRRHPRRA